MARTPAPKSTVETGIVQVLDRLEHDGKSYGEGDEAEMTLSEARQLRDLGVVTFVDPAPEPVAPAP